MDYHCICCNKTFFKKHHYIRHCSTTMHKNKESEVRSVECRAEDTNKLLEIVQKQGKILRKQADLLEKQSNTIMDLSREINREISILKSEFRREISILKGELACAYAANLR